MGLSPLDVGLELVGHDHGVVVHPPSVVNWSGERPEIELSNEVEAAFVPFLKPVLFLERALEHYPDVRQFTASGGKSIGDVVGDAGVEHDPGAGLHDFDGLFGGYDASVVPGYPVHNGRLCLLHCVIRE